MQAHTDRPRFALTRTGEANPSPSALLLLIACAMGCLVAVSGRADDAVRPADGATGEPTAAHRAWLAEVDPLITEDERQAFASLDRDYQRDAFIERFWDERDPFPETGQNEFREVWRQRVELARERFGDLDSEPARTLLLVGPPHRIFTDLCPELLGPLEAWSYDSHELVPGGFYLLFRVRGAPTSGAWARWGPIDGLEALLDWSADRPAQLERLPEEFLRRCSRGRLLREVLERAVDWRSLLKEPRLVPRPSDEWVEAFLDRTVRSSPESSTLRATLQIGFPGRHQSRTVVQGLLIVPREVAEQRVAGTASYNFRVDGEVLRQGELFERFRYRFDLPAAQVTDDSIPLVIQRYLRPGDYTVLLELEDLNSGRFFGSRRQIHVPAVTAVDSQAARIPEPDAPEARLAEANTALHASDHLVEILPLPLELLTGRVRVEARALGEDIARMTFVLNGRPVMSKTRPPYSVELDLGQAPRLHTLEAVAVDAAGAELARDRIPVNAGPHRFAVRLLEPRPGQRYAHSVRAHAEVDLPAGEVLDRVDFYLNESRLASLFQPPFVQPIVLPRQRRIDYVRAVAYLGDGNSAEDLVFINAPEQMDHLRINMVELYTTVCDRRGTPVEGLQRDDFRIWEEGVEQKIARFEKVRDLPIHAAVVLDASTSMNEELDEAIKAALRFFDGVVRPRDRAAVVVFNDAPILKVPFTNRHEVLAGGLAALESEGETALFDSLVFTLHYFSGIKGKRALILLSDGRDSRSRYSFAEALSFARRSGVAVYTIGLGVPHREMESRNLLLRLARETGGRSFFIAGARELKAIYASIEEELRSQYLLAYQSSHEEGGEFRRVEVNLERPGLKAKTIPGYYP